MSGVWLVQQGEAFEAMDVVGIFTSRYAALGCGYARAHACDLRDWCPRGDWEPGPRGGGTWYVGDNEVTVRYYDLDVEVGKEPYPPARSVGATRRTGRSARCASRSGSSRSGKGDPEARVLLRGHGLK